MAEADGDLTDDLNSHAFALVGCLRAAPGDVAPMSEVPLCSRDFASDFEPEMVGCWTAEAGKLIGLVASEVIRQPGI